MEPAFQGCCEGRTQHRVQRPLRGACDTRVTPAASLGGSSGEALGPSPDAGVAGTRWGMIEPRVLRLLLRHADAGGLGQHRPCLFMQPH